jgi:hypothetical protein
MAIQDRVRGTVEWDRLERVFGAIADRQDRGSIRVEFLEVDNWLSVPAVVDDDLFVKVITPQNSLVHAAFTAGRNLGVFASGREGFFERFEDPLAMAEHELAAVERMAAAGVDAPAPVDAFEVDGLGVLVLEYLPDVRPLSAVDSGQVDDLVDDLFGTLRRLHDAGLVHGDLRAENVLLSGGQLYFVDATKVRAEDGSVPGSRDALADARSYDLACALATTTPLVGPATAVEAARREYTTEELLGARAFLDFVVLRPDHDFDVGLVEGEIEKTAS